MKITKGTPLPPPKAPGYTEAHAHLDALASGTVTTFDGVRVAVAMSQAQMPDGSIHQAALDLGLKV